MCGRFTLHSNPRQLTLAFGCDLGIELAPRRNIAPTQPVLALRTTESGTREFSLLRWGLIPSWAKDVKIGNRMINARAETVAEKPSFRAAFRRRRCLIPADGYYEWKKEGRTKIPHLIAMKDEQPFAMAGLWESWRDPETDLPIESCTIITTDANRLTRPIHDRMPVILMADSYDLWLQSAPTDAQQLQALLQPFESTAMVAHAVEPLGRPGIVA